MKGICALALCVALALGGCGVSKPEPEGQRRGTVGFSGGLEQQTREEDAPEEDGAVPMGLDLDFFQSILNQCLENHDNYSVRRFYLTEGEFTDSFEYTFPNQEVLRGVVNKENQLVRLEFVYPSLSQDKNILNARGMVISACIMAALFHSETNSDALMEKVESVLTQLNLLNRTQEMDDRYEQGELFVSVCNGVRYTKQLDLVSEYSTFTAVSANEGEENTVSVAQP